MKTQQFRDHGLLWDLATRLGGLHEWRARRDGTDICHYTRCVLIGLLLAAIIAALVGCILGCFADLLMWMWFEYVVGVPIDLSDWGAAAMMLTAGCIAVGVVFLGGYLFGVYQEWKYERTKATLGDEVASMADAWKEKFCFRVTFGEQPPSQEE